jgi:hypothetical protein
VRVWFGNTNAPAIIAFREATLFFKGKPAPYINYRAHPIRRLYGFAIGRTVFGVIRCDRPRDERMERAAARALGMDGEQ